MSGKRFDKLLVLDLDETLVYAAEGLLDQPADFKVGKFHVYKRPGLETFLRRCLEWFEVGVWTSSSAEYAESLVSRLFDGMGPPAFVWSRARCVRRLDPEHLDYFWIKDLKKLKKCGYALEKILMIDDTPRKLIRNYGNPVRVREFTGDPADRELEALLDYLKELGPVADVRVVEKRGWRHRRPS